MTPNSKEVVIQGPNREMRGRGRLDDLIRAEGEMDRWKTEKGGVVSRARSPLRERVVEMC